VGGNGRLSSASRELKSLGTLMPSLSDELIASISLLLPFFDKQFEYSLSVWLVRHTI
jgi:hypothetical protein